MIEYDIFAQGKRYAMTMSFDDGCYDEKLIKIFNKYGIKGTFHLNSDILGDKISQIAEIYKGHEVSCHGANHRTLKYIPIQGIYKEIFRDRKNLEEQVGYPVVGMSYACSVYTDEIISALRSMGIVYSRTTESTDDYHIPNDFMKWHPTCHYKKCISKGEDFLKSMDGWFGYPKLLYVWGHGHEVQRYGDWQMIEDFCKMMSNNPRLWYATNIEIYRYITAQRSLVISADEHIVYNPSAITLWFSKDKKDYKIESGETLYV